MNMTCRSFSFEESAFMAVIDSPNDGWIQQSYDRFGDWPLPGCVGWRPIWTWTGQVLINHEPLGRSVQDDRRVGPITRLKELWQRLLASTIDLRQHMESVLGEGVRLPLPQLVRRSDRIGHEAQTTSGDSGGDDD